MPKFDETMLPILKELKDGKTYHFSLISRNLLDKYFSLTDDEKKETVSNGSNRFLDRAGWGRTYLKKAGLIEQPERGYVKITAEGQKILENGIQKIDVKFLSGYPSFMAFKNESKDNIKDKIIETSPEKMSPQDMIDSGFQNIQDSLKDDLIQKLRSTNPYFFERVVLLLFQKMGYGDFQETAKSGDGGVDGIINQDVLGLEKIYIQAKRYAEDNKVREPLIRDFIGAMSGDVRKGIFVTTSFFDEGAIRKAKDDHNHKIVLIDGDMLTDLMVKHNVGIQVQAEYQIKELDTDFFEEV